MSRTCELTGKSVMTGNNVSHAKNRNKRVFRPNLVNTTLMSEVLDRSFSFRVATSAIRTVEHNGGLDNYLLKAKDDVLSAKARKVKKEIKSKNAA
ncbi:MAG: 50S ribosomal protein L28 [Proteobacteria bacterium]|nr:50S ribosomal protein L28 [Pseudomonadota bacterium]